MNIAEIYSNKTNQEASANATISLPTGQLVFGTYSIKHGKIAHKQVKPGTYTIDAFFIDEDDMDNLNASVGLNMLVVHFSDEPIVEWEKVLDANEEEVITFDDFEFLMYDRQNTDHLEEREQDVEQLKELTYSMGLAGFENKEMVGVYIGEDAASHTLYWALDAQNQPVKLVGYFAYDF